MIYLRNVFLYKISVIIPLLLIAFAFSCTNRVTDNNAESETMTDRNEGSVEFNNSGSNAYVITEINGEGIEADVNVNNVEITLTIGGRYTFDNKSGASSHPLDFRDGDGNKLLGQSNSDGTYTENGEVNVVKEGDKITFTLTPDLSDDMVDYICSFHPPMNGSINVVE
ncbi:hypothetical protein [Fodinibius sp. Rm-B-1B1-1]|uniref:cupredoxin domain-containing protein n=1 Tax=Fodinibius alkaliphilus TaxID=3140241 RepID=UPI00315A28CF